MKHRTLSRRSLLNGLAGTSIALPWLEAMLPIKSAQGQAAKPPLRFVAFITTDGVFPQRFSTWTTGVSCSTSAAR